MNFRKLSLYILLTNGFLPFAAATDFDSVASKADRVQASKFISLGFASENMVSPVSSFGHTFLIFHEDKVPEPFAVVFEFYGNMQSENFIVKSLIGGIPGMFQLSEFSEKSRLYEREGRDLWVFEIELSPTEMEGLKVAVLSKVKENANYLFLTKNCSRYIHEVLVESFLDDSCKKRFYTAPIHSVAWLEDCGRIKSSFVKRSSARRVEDSLSNFSSDDKERVNVWLDGGYHDLSAESPDLLGLYSRVLNFKIPRTRHEYLRSRYLSQKAKIEEINGSGAEIFEPQKFVFPKTTSIHTGSSIDFDQFYLGFTPALSFFEMVPLGQMWSNNLEVMSGELGVSRTGSVSLSQLTVFNLSANQPGSFLESGLTRWVDLSYREYGLSGGNEGTFKRAAATLAGGQTFGTDDIRISLLGGLEGGYYERGDTGTGLAGFLKLETNLNFLDITRLRTTFSHYLETNNFVKTVFLNDVVIAKTENLSLSGEVFFFDGFSSSGTVFRLNYLFN